MSPGAKAIILADSGTAEAAPFPNHLGNVSIHRVVLRHYPLPAFVFERD